MSGDFHAEAEIAILYTGERWKQLKNSTGAPDVFMSQRETAALVKQSVERKQITGSSFALYEGCVDTWEFDRLHVEVKNAAR